MAFAVTATDVWKWPELDKGRLASILSCLENAISKTGREVLGGILESGRDTPPQLKEAHRESGDIHLASTSPDAEGPDHDGFLQRRHARMMGPFSGCEMIVMFKCQNGEAPNESASVHQNWQVPAIDDRLFWRPYESFSMTIPAYPELLPMKSNSNPLFSFISCPQY
jgi:hypothetical protein